MPFEVGTKDCTALSDAELAEMADLCVDREPGFDIGFLSKQCEEWVLVTLVREGQQAAGLFLLHPGAHRGHAVAAVGLATVDRTVKAEQALRLLLGDQYRRALLAFPDEDVLVGTRLARGRGVPGLHRPGGRGAPSRPQGQRARSGPGAGGWPSASAPRAASTTGPSSCRATARTAGALDLGGPKVKEPDDGRRRCCSRALNRQARRPAGGLRVGHGRGPRLGPLAVGQGRRS